MVSSIREGNEESHAVQAKKRNKEQNIYTNVL